MYAAADNPEVGAVASVAGAFSEPTLAVQLRGAENVEALRSKGRSAYRRYQETGEIETILAYHPTDKTAANVSPSQYYFDKDRGGGVGPWRNAFAVMAWEPWLDFDPVTQATKVTAPALIVHSDGSAFPDQARKVHANLAGPKELYWSQGAHFDFYDQSVTVSDAADHIADHFRKHLT